MNTIKCPNCSTPIELTEALTGQIEQALKAEYEQKAKDAYVEFDRIRQELNNDRNSLAEEHARISDKVNADVAEKLAYERKVIVTQERNRLQQEQSAELSDLKTALAEKDAKVVEMLQQELNLRKKARELEEFTKNLEVESARKLDAERASIKTEAARLADESNALKLREKDTLLAAMSEQLEALKRKAETGSQEGQGEAQEDILIQTLQQSFPFDAFEEVVKGARGGDIVQVVRNSTGKIAGRILWESKNTKAFSKQWIEKVKVDQMRVNASLSVIMTVTLPDYITDRGERFGAMEGVWITDLKSTVPLTVALRQGIIEADKQRVVSANQESLQALLYEYLTSKDAQMRIMAVIDAGNKMTDDLNKERNAMERLWAARQKNIENLTRNFTGFFGAMEGIIGRAALPAIPDPVAMLEQGDALAASL